MAGRVRLNFNEIGRILKSEPVRQELHRRGELINAAIDHEGYEVVSGVGETRARALVVARSPYARRSNALHNTLVSKIDAARD